MGYNKPGIEFYQVQKSQTPILVAPDLEGVVVGRAYWWQDPTWDNPGDPLHHSISSTVYDGTADVTIALSTINPVYNDIGTDSALVVVDLLGISGPDTGVTKHLLNGTDFTVATNVITLKGKYNDADLDGTSTYQVKVGFRAKLPTATGYNTLISLKDIEEILGDTVSWNPLAFGSYIAMLNSARSMNALVVAPTSTATDSIEALALKEVYAIAPMAHEAGLVTAIASHVNSLSEPVNKKERVAFVNEDVLDETASSMSSSERLTFAQGTRDTNAAYQNKRLASIFPDAVYIVETRHISTIKPSWINTSFASSTTKSFATGPYPKFLKDTIVGGIKYKAGQDITETIWTALHNANWGTTNGLVTVYAPVPGFYYAAQSMGQLIGTSPAQPLTNVPGGGLAMTIGSQDIFTEAELNVMAEGGTWIMTQDSPTGPIYCRHQMTTDISSVAKRELSIVCALDYTAKFLRKGLKPYIGRYNITPAFLKLVETILVGSGLYLVREGIVKDLKVLSVTQDENNPDTLYIDINILVNYPVNYIKIKLIF